MFSPLQTGVSVDEMSQLLPNIVAKVGIVTWVQSARMPHHGSAQELCSLILYEKKILRLSGARSLAILPAANIKPNQNFLLFLSFGKSIL